MGDDCLPRDRKPQPKPATVSSLLDEGSEKLLRLPSGEPSARVVDMNDDAILFRSPIDSHQAAFFRELDGVADQVGENKVASVAKIACRCKRVAAGSAWRELVQTR